MTLPETSRLSLAGDMPICPVVNGMWQVSGGHGRIDPARAAAAMGAYHAAGFTTWDLADHYGPAEDLIGAFRHVLGDRAGEIQAFTKWVPSPGPMTRAIVEAAVDVSRRRMGTDRLDLLQFHWWDYRDNRYLDALSHLADLRDAGKIRHLALTNFDTERVEVITDRGIRIVSNQVQYSLVDQRPAARMAAFCQAHGIGLLTYGTVLGGLLSEAWLGRAEPARGELATISQQKYKQMIDAWGGWPLFQDLLASLNTIAQQRGATIATMGSRLILDRPAVAGVIIGARLGIAEHIADNTRIFDLVLDPREAASLDPITARARDLMHVIGDCGDEYR